MLIVTIIFDFGIWIKHLFWNNLTVNLCLEIISKDIEQSISQNKCWPEPQTHTKSNETFYLTSEWSEMAYK